MNKIPNLYVLDRFEKAIGVLNPSLPNSCPFFDDLRTERIEYAYLTFEFSVPADHPQAQNLVVGNKIVYPLKNGQFNLFRIINTEDDHKMLSFPPHRTCNLMMWSPLWMHYIKLWINSGRRLSLWFNSPVSKS
ncbi:hypothetical protein [Thermoactinomyces daqus]|uniref:hypothetical protein n=1 Tax=Thermoactinomyces daqus TaxID=1329516 RepID=UPI00190F8FFF|nr:hypothetical protein [Thermoactinomyces daqus]